MDRNISADQVFDLLSGMAKAGIDMASESRRGESPDMDSLFDTPVSDNRRSQRSAPSCDPTSRRNDVGYASEPYQAGPNRGYNSRPQNTNPYSYGYGYASDPVPYSNRSQQRSAPAYRNGGYAPQQQTRRVNNAVNYNTNGGNSSASYGMGGYSSQSQYQAQPQQQNPYRSSEYDERNYAFPDDGFGYGGGYR
jgi:hypothetical protein